jgi:uncharacterized damage-inducible protein DinB
MKPDEVMTLYEYAWWARDRLLDAAGGMTDEEFARDNGFTYGSLRGILVHAMDAEESWCSRFLGETVAPAPEQDEITSVAELKTRWSAAEARFRAYLADVTEPSLAADFVITRRNGQEIRTPLWVLLTHVVNHGTQHRSEAAEALTMVGRSPGSLDLTTYVWQRSAGT